MTYKESYMKCNTLKELEEEVRSDIVIALMVNPDRLDVIKKNAEEVANLKFNDDMYWIDDPKSKYYNTLVELSKVNKDWSTAEHLIDYKKQYEFAIEIKSNPQNIPNKGSAIFLHCIKDYHTNGCIAIDRLVMKKILELIDKNTKIEIRM